jgi:carbonic anhydrase/acetyltransferase-like protein (isoleucine patch superfamily)
MADLGILSVGGKTPSVASTVFIAPGAYVVGDVIIADESSLWFNAVIRAEHAPVRIGARSNIQDGAVLHTDPGFPCLVGDQVTVGHRAIVHGATIGDGTTVGMGAIVLNGAVIGSNVIVAAGAVVLEGAEIPDGVLVAGIPAKVKRILDENGREAARHGAGSYVRNAIEYQATMQRLDEIKEGVSRGD